MLLPVAAVESCWETLAKQRSLWQVNQMNESNQQHAREMHIAHLHHLSAKYKIILFFVLNFINSYVGTVWSALLLLRKIVSIVQVNQCNELHFKLFRIQFFSFWDAKKFYSIKSIEFAMISFTLSNQNECDCSDYESMKLNLLTANRKSPGFRPAISATPFGSTSSKYCSPGHRSVGLSCISGDAALAPRNTKPNPLLARWRTTVFASIIPLKSNHKQIECEFLCFQFNFKWKLQPSKN